MPAKDRPPSFQFYPREYLSSRAVAAMHPTARGGYVHLLCHAWLSDRPGWLPDDDALLAAISGLGERWLDHRETIARAWRVRRGWWIQVRMVETRRAQKRRWKQASSGAKATNAKRWGANDSIAQRHDSESRIVTPSSSSSSSSSSSKNLEAEPKTRAAPAAFVRPSLIEVQAYCQERAQAGHRVVDPQAWLNHYESNGWRVGKNAMKDWRAAVRTWERSDFGNGNGKTGKMSAADIRAFAKAKGETWAQ